MTETMSDDDDDDDQLARDVLEFDRLMSARDAAHLLEADESRDVAQITVDSAKPDVDADVTGQDGIELVQLPLPHDKDKSRRPAAWHDN